MPKHVVSAADGARDDDTPLTQEDREQQAALDNVDLDDDGSVVEVDNQINDQEDGAETEAKDPPAIDDDRLARMEKISAAKNKADDVDEDEDQDDQDQPDDENVEEDGTDNGDNDKVVAEQEEPSDPEPKKFVVKVNKQEIELSEEELIANAQQHLAGDQKNEKLLSNLLARLSEKDETRVQEQDSTSAATSKATTPDVVEDAEIEDKLLGLVDQIQTGDAREGLSALREFVAQNANDVSPEKITDMVTNILETQKRSENGQQALKSFAEDNSDLSDNDDAMTLVFSKSIRAMEKEMIDIVGVDPAALAGYRNNPEAMNHFHSEYTKQGFKLTPIDQVLSKAAGNVRQILNVPKTDPVADTQEQTFVQQREQRKRAVSSQPTTTGTSRGAQRRVVRKEPQSRSATIKEMQASRG